MNIRTERLLLTDFHSEDATALFSYRSLPEVSKYQGWRPESLEEVEEFVQNLKPLNHFEHSGWYQIAVRLPENQKLIGDIGFHVTDNPDTVELGVTLHPDYQSQGYAREAFSKVISYAFNELCKERIVCSVDPRNASSVKLLVHLGFQLKELIKEAYELHGEMVDDMIFMLSKGGWKHE
jgi:RimJ/RimL family protein N-acetyltransferase